MKKNILQTSVLVALTALFFGCATMKGDIHVSSDDTLEEDSITILERRVTELDALTFAGNAIDDSSANITRVLDAAKHAASSVQKAQYAKLQALQGRIYLMEGKRAKAKECYEDSAGAYKGEVQGIILANRLGLVPSLDDEVSKLTSSYDKALITLEKALQSFGEEQYAVSLSQFDTAFISLPAFYKNSYGSIRNKAWEYRNVSGGKKYGTELLKKNEITVGQMLVISCAENERIGSLLGGSSASQNALYRKACALGFLSSATLTEESLPQENQRATKAIASRFLWSTYAYINGMENTAPYTEKLSRRKASPFPDVPFGSADFDAVMGSVENEFLNLSDGIHFEPDASISALTVSEASKKIR